MLVMFIYTLYFAGYIHCGKVKILLYPKFHMSVSGGPLFTTIRTRTTEYFHTATLLYSLQTYLTYISHSPSHTAIYSPTASLSVSPPSPSVSHIVIINQRKFKNMVLRMHSVA
jgi:hypothetical protein